MMQEGSIPPICEVVIITALGLEYKAVSEHLQDMKEITYQGTVYGYGTFTGQHRIWHVTVAEIGMGGPTAAAETERAISYFRPLITLFVGIGGGLKDVKLGHVVAASKVYAYESGKVEQKFQPRPEAWRASYSLEQRARAEARNDEWLTRLGGSYPDPAPQVHIGALAAGEKVLASTQSDLFRLLKETYGDTLAVEMEGHGFLTAVHANHSVHALVIRGISDLIDGKSASDAARSQTVAARHAAAFAFQVLAKFIFSEESSKASPKSRLPEVWNIPYQRNPFFTGRDEILKRLYTQFQQKQIFALSQPQVFSGLGGIGKTQLAIEYAYRFHQNYHEVFWARADSIEMLNSSYAEIARLLNLSQEDIVQEMKTWLHTHRNWLLILDNADDPALLSTFLPSAPEGHILLTTRVTDLGGLGLGIAHSIRVETFSSQQGMLFLLRRAGLLALDAGIEQVDKQDQELALQITQELGALPLALDLAGAYIAANAIDLGSYLLIFQHHRARLLEEQRNLAYPKSIATTWNISFERVEADNPAAADLLRLCAHLAPDAIPEEILTRGASFLGPLLKPVANDSFAFAQAIEVLRTHSLLDRDSQTHTVSMHRLVQIVLRDSMTDEARATWRRQAVLAVHAACPDVKDMTQWDACERWLPHALISDSWIEQEQFYTKASADLLNQAGYHLHMRSTAISPDVMKTEALLKRALVIYEQHLGMTHPDTAQCLQNLALISRSQRKYAEAEALLKRALVIYEQHLEPTHPDTARCLHNLATIYYDQKMAAQAKLLLKRAIEIQKNQLDPVRLDFADSLNSLSTIYAEEGNDIQARLMLALAIDIRTEILGPMHPDLIVNLCNLATLHIELGEYAGAESLLKHALAICEQHFGAAYSMHRYMKETLSLLSALYTKQRRYVEAESTLKRELIFWEQQPDTPEAQEMRAMFASLIQKVESRSKRRGWKRVIDFFSFL